MCILFCKMNLSFCLVTLVSGLVFSVSLPEEGEGTYIGKVQDLMTELTDMRNADGGKTKRFLDKLQSVRQARSELKMSPLKSVERGYDDVGLILQLTERHKTSKKECPAETVRCGNTGGCIPTSWICDGYDDCGDNWDEQNCGGEGNITTPNVPCDWSEWSDWTGCNTGCDAGLRQRSRTCLCQDGGCDGESTEWEECPDNGCFPEADSGCGTRVIKGGMHRIVGGEKAARGAWPWQVQLFSMKEGSFECGGTLVGPRHVISAAHCFHRSDPIYRDANNWIVQFGKQDLSRSVGDGETTSSVEKLIIHEKYDDDPVDNDIAMMILTEEQTPSNKINFACLDLDHIKQFDNSSDCFITGWGATSWLGKTASELQEANVPLIDRDICNQRDYYDGDLTVNMMCAGFVAGGVDSCQGDSGGPLVCSAKDSDKDLERWYLVGVTSWGYGCALPNHPGVYADVSKYTSWIKKHINCN